MGGKQSKQGTSDILHINTEKELEPYLPYIEEELRNDAEALSKSSEDIHFYHIQPNPIKITNPSAEVYSFFNKTLELNPNVRAFAVSKYIQRPHILAPVFTRGYALHWIRGSI